MKQAIAVVLAVTGLVLLASNPACLAQTPSASGVAPLLRKLQALNQLALESLADIDGLERQANTLLVLVVIVALFGAATSVLQVCQHRMCRISVGALGILITTITIFNNTAYSGDFRTLKHKAQQARLQVKLADASFKAVDAT